MSSKETRKGDIAELKFAYEAKKRNYNISFPAGADSEYDLILEHKGNTSRVQVKSVKAIEENRDAYRVNVTRGTKKNKLYTKEDCDVVAVYVHDMDCFYFIPVERLEVSTIRLYPHRPEIKEGLEDTYERWSVF